MSLSHEKPSCTSHDLHLGEIDKKARARIEPVMSAKAGSLERNRFQERRGGSSSCEY